MGKIREIAGDGAPMPGFGDGMVDMAGPIGAMAESPVDEAMGARADGAREGGNRRNGCRERKPVAGVGAISLGIPRPRAGSHSPEGPIGRYPRAGRAVAAAVPETVADGAPAGCRGYARRRTSRSPTCGDATRQTPPAPTSGSTRPASSAGTRAARGRPRRSPPSAPARAGAGAFRGPAPSTPGPTAAGGRSRCRRAHARPTARSASPATPARASSARSGGPPGRRVAAPHRASDAQRRRQRADRAEMLMCNKNRSE